MADKKIALARLLVLASVILVMLFGTASASPCTTVTPTLQGPFDNSPSPANTCCRWTSGPSGNECVMPGGSASSISNCCAACFDASNPSSYIVAPSASWADLKDGKCCIRGGSYSGGAYSAYSSPEGFGRPASDCCSGQQDLNGNCLPECTPSGEAIALNGNTPSSPNCCPGSQYNSATQTCGPPCTQTGGSCTTSNQCCSGLVCSSSGTTAGTCQPPPPPPCSSNGGTCASGVACCVQTPPLFCDTLNNLISPVCKTCNVQTESCTGTGQGSCCSGLVCDSSSHTCEVPPCTQFMCSSSEFNNVMMLSGLASLGMALLIALVYMLGHFFQAPKLLDWSKLEVAQMFVSLIIVSIILFILSSFCTMQIGEFGNIFGILPPLHSGYETNNLYCAADRFMQALQKLGLDNMAMLRYNMGVYEIRSTFTNAECDSICLYSMTTVNVAVFAGDSMDIALTHALLSTATISYLSSAFQYFTLQYIYNGLFLIFLPIAIVMRSIPFMRHFGGALIAIFIGLYLLYPMLIAADSLIAPGLAADSSFTMYDRSWDSLSCGGAMAMNIFATNSNNAIVPFINCIANDKQHSEEGLGGGLGVFGSGVGISENQMNDMISSNIIGDAIKLNVLIFLTSVFLPIINFIVLAAFVKGISHFLGEEADISRLGQMV